MYHFNGNRANQPVFFGPPRPPGMVPNPGPSRKRPHRSSPTPGLPAVDPTFIRQPTIVDASVACTGNGNSSCPCCKDETCDKCKAWATYWFEVKFLTAAARRAQDPERMTRLFRSVGLDCHCPKDFVVEGFNTMIQRNKYPCDIDDYVIYCRDVGMGIVPQPPGDHRARLRSPYQEDFLRDGKLFFLESVCTDEADCKLIAEADDLDDLCYKAWLVEWSRTSLENIRRNELAKRSGAVRD